MQSKRIIVFGGIIALLLLITYYLRTHPSDMSVERAVELVAGEATLFDKHERAKQITPRLSGDSLLLRVNNKLKLSEAECLLVFESFRRGDRRFESVVSDIGQYSESPSIASMARSCLEQHGSK